jgi:hypothetical protein
MYNKVRKVIFANNYSNSHATSPTLPRFNVAILLAESQLLKNKTNSNLLRKPPNISPGLIFVLMDACGLIHGGAYIWGRRVANIGNNGLNVSEYGGLIYGGYIC